MKFSLLVLENTSRFFIGIVAVQKHKEYRELSEKCKLVRCTGCFWPICFLLNFCFRLDSPTSRYSALSPPWLCLWPFCLASGFCLLPLICPWSICWVMPYWPPILCDCCLLIRGLRRCWQRGLSCALACAAKFTSGPGLTLIFCAYDRCLVILLEES